MLERSVAEVRPHPGGGGVGGVEGRLDVLGGAAGDLGERLAVDGRDVLEVGALDRVDPRAPDVVAVAAGDLDRRAVPAGC